MSTIADVRLDLPAVFQAFTFIGCGSRPTQNCKQITVAPEEIAPFIDALKSVDRLDLIEETLQDLAMRADGTLLKSASPSLTDFAKVVKQLSATPRTLLQALELWESTDCSEVMIDFIDLNQPSSLKKSKAY
ncbi:MULTISPECIES: hypothetical protein [Aeromonas]|uniref:hypothetical protein n=1 Tax=Aeromonas TaxID=642 RepID=UPI002B059E22|nr:hypothetical protein [Aeromonas jandaei]